MEKPISFVCRSLAVGLLVGGCSGRTESQTDGSVDAADGSDATIDAVVDGAIGDVMEAGDGSNISCATVASWTDGGIGTDLGHQAEIVRVHRMNNRVVSGDIFGRWILWDVTAGTIMSTGSDFIGAEGNVFATGTTPVTLRSLSTGAMITTLNVANYWNAVLARDGSYLYTTSKADGSLTVWSTTNGLPLFTKGGANYAAFDGDCAIYAAPNELRIVRNNSSVETLAVPSGSSNIQGSFTGIIGRWFEDGQRFLMQSLPDLQVRDKTGANLGLIPNVLTSQKPCGNAGGYGDNLWVRDPSNIATYTVGGNGSATLVYSLMVGEPSVYAFHDSALWFSNKFIDLTKAPPNATVVKPIPFEVLPDLPSGGGALSVDANGNWARGDRKGRVLVRDGSVGDWKALGCGFAFGVGASQAMVWVPTAVGQLLSIDTKNQTMSATPTNADQVLVNDVGYGLTTSNAPNGVRFDTTVDVVATGNWSKLQTITRSNVAAIRIALAKSSDVWGAVITPGPEWFVRDSKNNLLASGMDTVDVIDALPLAISPNGTRFLLWANNNVRLYKGSTPLATIPGQIIGWLDDNSFLVQQVATYAYDKDGNSLGARSLPGNSTYYWMAPRSTNAVHVVIPYFQNDLVNPSNGQIAWSGKVVTDPIMVRARWALASSSANLFAYIGNDGLYLQGF
jgi:hypothetical protein